MVYMKPDIICGTESCLNGVKPGRDPDKNAVKTSEVFPDTLTVTRNDRTHGIGGGVFVATSENIMQDPQPQLGTDCEIVWTKLRLKNSKDLLVCFFYMPHRNMTSVKNLNESVKKITETTSNKHIIVAGDFNCPNINWDTLSVERGAPDREVQQALIDFSIEHGLQQMQRQPTRDNNLLDLIFTTNPSLVKASSSVPGISDHAMVVTDIDIIPNYVKQKPHKVYQYSKASWDVINTDLGNLHTELINLEKQDIDSLWEHVKKHIFGVIEKHIPSKLSKKRKSLPLFSHKLKRLVKKKARLYKHAKINRKLGAVQNLPKTMQKRIQKSRN